MFVILIFSIDGPLNPSESPKDDHSSKRLSFEHFQLTTADNQKADERSSNANWPVATIHSRCRLARICKPLDAPVSVSNHEHCCLTWSGTAVDSCAHGCGSAGVQGEPFDRTSGLPWLRGNIHLFVRFPHFHLNPSWMHKGASTISLICVPNAGSLWQCHGGGLWSGTLGPMISG